MAKKITRIGLFIFSLLFHSFLFAESAKITFVKGKVEVQNGSSWSAVTVGQELPESSVVSTGFNSEVRFQYNGTVMALGPLTRVTLEKIANTETKEVVNVFLNTGAVRTKVTHPTNKRVSQTVRNPISVASVRGTDYMFFDSGKVSCFEGAVATFPAFYLKNISFAKDILNESNEEDNTEYESATATTEPQEIADFAPPTSVVVAAGQSVVVLENGQIEKPSNNVKTKRDKNVNLVISFSQTEGISMGEGTSDFVSHKKESFDVPKIPQQLPQTGSVDVNVSFE